MPRQRTGDRIQQTHDNDVGPRGQDADTWNQWQRGDAHGSARYDITNATARTPTERLARGLGWFSLGLGITALAVPDRLARTIGMRGGAGTRTVLRLVGLREIGSGVGILASRWSVGWLSSRVAGDAMDLTLLSRALASATPAQMPARTMPGRRWMPSLRRTQSAGDGGAERTGRAGVVALAALLGITAIDTWCSLRLTLIQARRLAGTTPAPGRGALRGGSGQHIAVRQSVTIMRSAGELYGFWRDFTNLPRVMRHLESVQVTGDRRSYWRAKAPAGQTVEWDAEIIEDQPNERIAWQSLPGASVPNAGSVRFVPAPGDRGTEIHVELRYDPPGGKLGKLVAKLFGEEPTQQVSDDLRRFKQLMETGEITRSDATLWGQGLLQHPAQPPRQLPATVDNMADRAEMARRS